MDNQKRNKRTTRDQMIIIINYININKILITGKCHPLKAKELEEKWDELVNMVNTVENGARKDKKQWKHFLAEWKSKVKKKARMVKDSLKKTGGGSGLTELSDIESMLMDVIGWVSVTGCHELPLEIDPNEEIIELEFQGDMRENLENIELGTTEVEPNKTLDYEMVEAAEITAESTTPIQTKIKNKKAVYTTMKTNKVRRAGIKQTSNVGGSSLLQQSAEVFAESNKRMAEAVKEMASSVSELAVALASIAEALKCLAHKKGETCA